MAEMEEEKETKEEKESEEKKAPKKKKSKALIFLALIVVVLGGLFAGAYHFYGDKILKKDKKEDIKEDKVEKKEEKKVGAILTLDPFLLNLSGSIQRYAKISISLEFKDAKTLEHAKKIVPALRDGIIYVLGSKTAETLLDVTGRETIKSEISEKIKGLFDDQNSIKAVYITDIVIQ